MSEPTPETKPRPAEPVPADDPRIVAFRHLVGIVDRLREPDGCPWDRKQTEASMAPHLIEEAHELLEAIETGEADEIAAEAGDVLMNVLLICRIAQESGRFDLAATANAISEKLVRRHPHVFGDVVVSGSEEVLTNWEAIKRDERQEREQDASALAGVPRSLPALQRAGRVCEKAVSAGFRWQDVQGAFAKVEEEIVELAEVVPAEVRAADWKPELGEEQRERIEHELGDVLLAGAFFGRYLGLDPEHTCRAAVRRFETRFRTMEAGLGGDFAGLDLERLIEAWDAAKVATSPG